MSILSRCCCFKSVKNGSFATGLYTLVCLSIYYRITSLMSRRKISEVYWINRLNKLMALRVEKLLTTAKIKTFIALLNLDLAFCPNICFYQLFSHLLLILMIGSNLFDFSNRASLAEINHDNLFQLFSILILVIKLSTIISWRLPLAKWL